MPSSRLLLTAALFAVSAPAQFLPIVTANPQSIAADSGATKVLITGADFTAGMIVKWNGEARSTEFRARSELRVTLTSRDLATPTLGTLSVWDASLGAKLSDDVLIDVYLPIWNNYLLLDPGRERIYVSVSQKQTDRGPAVAVLNPETARIERYFALSAEPGILALSGDGRYLYVALDTFVRRIDLTTWTVDLDIPLGGNGQRHVASMVVLPETPTSLVVSFGNPSSNSGGTGVFDGAALRRDFSTNVAPALLGGPDDQTQYGADSSGGFYVMKLNSSGLSVVQTVPGLLTLDGDPVYAGGLVYSGWGTAIDPIGPSLVRAFGAAGLIQPVPASQAVLILGGDTPPGWNGYSNPPHLELIDTITSQRLWSIPLPVHFDRNHGPMVQWGENGVAFREYFDHNQTSSIHLFRVNLSRDAKSALLPEITRRLPPLRLAR